MTSLPDWIKPVDGYKARYVLDPDKFYPKLLGELAEVFDELDAEKPDQYWLEVSHQMVKLDASVAIQAAGLRQPDVALVLIIRGGEGYKERWALKHHPLGDRLEAMLKRTRGDRKKADRLIARESREHFKKLRGFAPS